MAMRVMRFAGVRALAPMRAAVLTRPSAVTAQSVRGYSTELASIFKREHEQELSNPIQDIPVPNKFTMEDTPGSNCLVLKSTNGSETITVQCVIPRHMEVDTEVNELAVDFTVLVQKEKAGVVEVECRTAEEGFDLQGIAWYEHKDRKVAMEESAEADYKRDLKYHGPALQDLESDMQEELVAYLEERGIDAALSKYMQEYILTVKEPKEYVRWLGGLASFMAE